LAIKLLVWFYIFGEEVFEKCNVFNVGDGKMELSERFDEVGKVCVEAFEFRIFLLF